MSKQLQPENTQAAIERKRILLVENDAPVRDGLARALTAERYEVVTAASGHEAIQRIEGAHIDAMLLDLDRHDDCRWQTVRHLTTKNPFMPVIGMTARANRHWLADAADLEALLYKPFDVTSLLRIVAAFPRMNLN